MLIIVQVVPVHYIFVLLIAIMGLILAVLQPFLQVGEIVLCLKGLILLHISGCFVCK